MLWKRYLPSKDGEALSEMREKATVDGSKEALGHAVDAAAQWFAAYTTPRHEKHVAELLAERRIETFLPLYRSTRQWKKSCPVELELPLFPTYVFVRIANQARSAVLGLPGVISIVGSPKNPWPLPDFEIEALRQGLLMRKAEPHPYLKAGEKVRIKTGVMSGLQGILIRVKSDLRVVLSLDTIMRSIAVEVDAYDLELVDQRVEGPAIHRAAQALA